MDDPCKVTHSICVCIPPPLRVVREKFILDGLKERVCNTEGDTMLGKAEVEQPLVRVEMKIMPVVIGITILAV